MTLDPARVHRLKNKLAVILGFCELLMSDIEETDPRYDDVRQIQIAAREALSELPALGAHELADAIGLEAGDGSR